MWASPPPDTASVVAGGVARCQREVSTTPLDKEGVLAFAIFLTELGTNCPVFELRARAYSAAAFCALVTVTFLVMPALVLLVGL